MKKSLRSGIAWCKRRYAKRDVVAALIVTAISIPESLGYAVIVGLPPVTGLYTALVAPFVFALCADTRRLVVGADSATAALIASGALLVAQSGTAGYAGAVGAISLLTASILVLMALFRLGFLADLISRPVMVGFLAGVGIQLIVTRIPDMLGLTVTGSLWQHVAGTLGQLSHVNVMTLTISVLVVGMIALTRRMRLSGELIGLVAAALLAAIFHVSHYGVALVSALPSGLPEIGLVLPSISQLITILPTALALALVILAQSSSVIRNSASEHDEPVKLNRDLLALGAANVATAMTHGFIANGSPPRTLAADVAGGKSQMVNIYMSLFIALILLCGTSLFQYIPEAALASIVCMLGVRLIRLNELKRIWSLHRAEFFVALVALVGTALFGVLQGVLIAVLVSLMERLSRQYHPRDDILLRDGQLSHWAVERLGGDQRDVHVDGLLVYSFDESLFFENSSYFVARIGQAVAAAKRPVTYVLVDAGAIDSVDYTATESLKLLYRRLSTDGIMLGFAHVSPYLLNQFDTLGITDLVGSDNIFSTLAHALRTIPDSYRTVSRMISSLGLTPAHSVIVGGAVLDLLHLRQATSVDIVVDDETYAQYRMRNHWTEYRQHDGTSVLSHEGIAMMHSWVGYSFKRIQRDAHIVDGISLMSTNQLVAAKQQLGRRKDMSDIALLLQYRNSERS